MTAIRSRGALRLHTRDAKVRLAAATARSTSAAVPALTSHKGDPVAGLTTVKRPLATEPVNLTSMQCPFSERSVAARACQSAVLKDANVIRIPPVHCLKPCDILPYRASSGVRAASRRRNQSTAGELLPPTAIS